MVAINDIIWLERIVEKLAWKHHVLPSEVEEIFIGDCKFFRKEKGKVEGEHLYNALGKTEAGRFLSVFFYPKARKQGSHYYGKGYEQKREEAV